VTDHDNRYDRQKLAFGQEGHDKVAATRVAIVGLGGTGCHVAQQLAYLGVKDIVLIDDDVVEETNLNRLVGATMQDALERRPKVEVIGRHVRAINEHVQLTMLKRNLMTTEALELLIAGPDVVFGCVDNDAARFVLNHLAAAYGKPLIDVASEIIVDRDGKLKEFGGRVIVALPGTFCLLCAGEIDLEAAKQALESPEERAYREKHGYGLGPQARSPSVVSMNGVVSSLAVGEFIALVTGLRPPERMLTYHGMRGVVTKSSDTKRPECRICNDLVGKRDAADIMRFVDRSKRSPG